MTVLSNLPHDLVRKRVVRTKEAALMCGLSVSTFRKMKGRVPKPIRLSDRLDGYRLGDLLDWLDCRATGREWTDCKGANDNANVRPAPL